MKIVKMGSLKDTLCQDPNSEFIIELTNSIREIGLQVPLIVKKIDETHFEVIDGNKRLSACQKLNYEEVPVIVREVKDEREQIILSLVTNLQRHTLTPLEIANSIKHLMDLEMTQEEIAKRIGKSQAWVQVRFSLLRLEPETLKLIGPETPADKRLSQSKAYMLVGIPPTNQVELAKTISSTNISVADARKIVSREVKEKNIPVALKNTSRLCLIESVKKFDGFIKRTHEHLENFLSMDNKKFHEIFEGETLEKIKSFQAIIEESAASMTQLHECLQSVYNSKLSQSKAIEMTQPSSETVEKEVDVKTEVPEVNNINPEKAGTSQLLLYIGVPSYQLYPPQKRKDGKKMTFWKRNIDHQEILKIARQRYMKRIKEIHPDVCPNSTENVALLNEAWNTLKHRFELHGFNLKQ